MSSGGVCTSNSYSSPSSRLASYGTVSGGEISRPSAPPGSNSRTSASARCTVTSARNTRAVEYSLSRANSAGSVSSGSRAANRWPVRNGSVITPPAAPRPAALQRYLRRPRSCTSTYGLTAHRIEAYSETRAVMTAGPPQLQQYTSPGDTSRSLPWMSHVPQVYAARIVSLSFMSSTTGSQSARSADGTSMTIIR